MLKAPLANFILHKGYVSQRTPIMFNLCKQKLIRFKRYNMKIYYKWTSVFIFLTVFVFYKNSVFDLISVQQSKIYNVLKSDNITNPFYRKKIEPLHVCIGTCNAAGVGSQLSAIMYWYNFSVEYGFKVHFGELFLNYDENEIWSFKSVLPTMSYYPTHCDLFIPNSWVDSIFVHKPFLQFPLTPLWVDLFQKHYSRRLSKIAQYLYNKLIREIPKNTTVIATSIRTLTYGAQDRQRRQAPKEDYDIMKSYLRANYANNTDSVLYLIIGDNIGVHDFLSQNQSYELMWNLENWIRNKIDGLDNIQVYTISVDILSRFKLRMLMRGSNQHDLQLAFHYLNMNTKNVVLADVFTMKIYDYYDNIITTVSDTLHTVDGIVNWNVFKNGLILRNELNFYEYEIEYTKAKKNWDLFMKAVFDVLFGEQYVFQNIDSLVAFENNCIIDYKNKYHNGGLT